ncbi:MAG: hypothetical protein ACHQD8_02440, partial [Chitinophagales bacterium]
LMTTKKNSLFLVAVLAIVVIFSIPFYNHWINIKFNDETNRIYEQSRHLTPEERMEARFGTTYLVLSAIKRMLISLNAQNVVILLPPRDYIKAAKVQDGSFEVPEPAVFYYFTGYRAIAKNSPEVGRANWALMVENHKMVMRHINNRQFLDSIITLYKPYN